MSSFGDGSRIARLETPKIEARGLETPRIDRLVSFGSSIVDITAYLPKLPDRGGDVLATDSAISVGGSFNLESAAARLGLAVVHTAPIGVGPNADLVRRALADEIAGHVARDGAKARPAIVAALKAALTLYVDNDLAALATADGEDAKPTAGFQRVIQRAVIHVQSSGREEVSGANVLVAIFSERESHAAYFLQEQDMTRYDAVNFIAHGVAKDPSYGEARPVKGADAALTGPYRAVTVIRETT